jgi:hypothetical protein
MSAYVDPYDQPTTTDTYGGYVLPHHGQGQYRNYFANLDDLGRGALQDNPMVGYGQIAGQLAPNSNSNYYRYLMSQYGRLFNQYQYESLANPNRGWVGFMNEHVPQLQQEFGSLPAVQRGERQLFPWGGGRYLG